MEETMNTQTQKLVETLGQLTVLQMCELVKTLEQEWGVSAKPVAPTPTKVTKVVPEVTGYKVVLTSPGDKRIPVIKEVRALLTIGLKEARDLIDDLPRQIAQSESLEEAEQIQARFANTTAHVTLQPIS